MSLLAFFAGIGAAGGTAAVNDGVNAAIDSGQRVAKRVAKSARELANGRFNCAMGEHDFQQHGDDPRSERCQVDGCTAKRRLSAKAVW